jgi:acetyl esterase
MDKEQDIRKAKRLQAAYNLYRKTHTFFKSDKNINRNEMHIKTNFGPVTVLAYGFNDPQVKPVFFDMHGGGFVLGDASMDEAINLEILKNAACKIVSIDYAKAPKFQFPYALEQIYSLVEYFYDNADTLGINRDKMAIGGHSAGGNLSTVTCMKAKAGGKFQFTCQILDYPPLDAATNPYEKPQPKGCIPPNMAMMFNNCYVDPEKAKDKYVSPIFADSETVQGLPPALIILAGKDSLYNEGKEYSDKLKKAGVPVTCYEYQNEKHGFTYEKSEARDDAVKKMIEFLQKQLV